MTHVKYDVTISLELLLPLLLYTLVLLAVQEWLLFHDACVMFNLSQ